MKKTVISIVFGLGAQLAIAQTDTGNDNSPAPGTKHPKKEKAAKENNCTNPKVRKSGKSITYTYNYDFSNINKGNDCNVMPRHKKDLIYINVSNINRLVYDIEQKGSSEKIELGNISIFDSLAASIKTNNIDNSTGTVDDTADSSTTKSVTKTVKAKNGKSKKVTTNTTVQNPYFEQQSRIIELQKSINANFSSWVDLMQQLEYFANYSKNAVGLIEAECCSQQALKESLLTEPNVMLFDNAIYDPANINISVDYKKLVSVFNTRPSQLAAAIRGTLETMKKQKKEADELIADVIKFCEHDGNAGSAECKMDKYKDNYPPAFDKAVAAAEKIDLQKIAEAASALNKIFQKVSNAKNFSYQMLAPYKPENDYYDAKLLLKPKQEFAQNIKADSIVNSYLVKNRFEWAVGPAINFHLSKSLLDESFRIDSARGTSGIARKDTFSITRNDNRNKMIPSIGIMAHFFWQKHAAVTPGIVLGLATSPSELKDLRAYLGGSLMLGGLGDKVFLNTGFAFGWSNRLKSNLVIGENPKSQIPFTGDKIASPDQLTERTFHAGWFFGLTYKIQGR